MQQTISSSVPGYVINLAVQGLKDSITDEFSDFDNWTGHMLSPW